MAERVRDMAEAASQQWRTAAQSSAVPGEVSSTTVETVLSHIHYFRVHTATEQRALLHSLDAFLRKHSQVGNALLAGAHPSPATGQHASAPPTLPPGVQASQGKAAGLTS
jgi:uncharacterized protein YfaA (DUF2138 family)